MKKERIYERRWGIEVIFKECGGYLGLGKCQSRSYNAQIADTTLCFMMYQMFYLVKRFSEYETLGALFRSERDTQIADMKGWEASVNNKLIFNNH